MSQFTCGIAQSCQESGHREFVSSKTGRALHYEYRLRWGCLPDYRIRSDPLHSVEHAASERRAADYINALGIYASQSHVPSPANFPIDVTLISGRFEVVDEDGDAIPAGDKTCLQAPPEIAPYESYYETPETRDYNGDDNDDHVSELGALTDQFITDVTDEDREKLYGVSSDNYPGRSSNHDCRAISLAVVLQKTNFDKICNSRHQADFNTSVQTSALCCAVWGDGL